MGARKFKTKETGELSAAKNVRMDEETIVRMDETIWKELPEELLESIIIERVPIATIIRFRSVCHKWNSLPFLQRRAPQELPLIYAAVYDRGWGAMYDPLEKKWYYNTNTLPYYHRYGPTRDYSGGLVCYADDADASFRVGNHLTQTWKVFPWSATTKCSLVKRPFTLAFVHNPARDGGYKIVWVDWEGKYEVLDCSSEKITVIEGRIPANFVRHFNIGSQGLAIGSVVYLQCREPDGIMSYDVVSGTWGQLLIAYPPNSHIVSLAEGEGRLLLVGWVDCNKDNNAVRVGNIRPCLYVWELDTQTQSWIEVDRMPTSECYKNYSVFSECLSNRRLLVVSLCGRLSIHRTKERFRDMMIFTYDVVSREWSKVLDCIPPGHSWPQVVWRGVSFFPCLY